ncbi:MAG: hypothetical protein WCJ64_04400 [Rhodospirillaceae bacterium]
MPNIKDIVEAELPGWKVVESRTSDSPLSVDAHSPELHRLVHLVEGGAACFRPASSFEEFGPTGMAIIESKAGCAPRRVVIIENGKIIGEQG